MSESARKSDPRAKSPPGAAETGSPADVWVPFAAWVVLIGALTLFAVLKMYCFRFSRGDEHLYNAMSLLLLDGKWPYRDFFFAHPPLPLYLTAGIFSVTGYSLVASKSVPILAAMSSGVHVFLIGRRSFGPVAGALAAILFLFTFDVIRGSSHPTGANVAVAFILAGTYQVFCRRFVLAGVLLGCAALTGVYAVPMMLMLVTLLALRSFAEAGRFALGFGAFAGSVLIVFTAVTGSAIWSDIVGYSLGKEAMAYSWFDKFEHVFFLNFHALMGFLPAFAWPAARWWSGGRRSAPATVAARLPGWMQRLVVRVDPWSEDRIGGAIFCATIAFGYFFFYSNLKVYYSYYFMLVFPWMALLTAYFFVDLGGVLWRSAREYYSGAERGRVAVESRQAKRKRHREAQKGREASASAPVDRKNRLLPIAAGVVALVGTFAYRDQIGEIRAADSSSPVRYYRFTPSPYLSVGINRLIEGAYWSPVRDRRDPPRGITRYLQHETLFAPTIERFREGVRTVCHAGDRIFGDYSLAPYAHAVSECRVAADLIDTNSARLTGGESTMSDWIDAVEADGLSVAIWRDPSAYSRNREFREYILGNFPEVVFEWRDRHVGRVQLRRRSH